MLMVSGTGDEIRTHTPSPALQPECSASANFATPAKKLKFNLISTHFISRKAFRFESRNPSLKIISKQTINSNLFFFTLLKKGNMSIVYKGTKTLLHF